jgi:hypothetical protein
MAIWCFATAVCIASVDKISKSLGKDDKKSLETIEDAVKRWCKQQAHGSKEERFVCFVSYRYNHVIAN